MESAATNSLETSANPDILNDAGGQPGSSDDFTLEDCQCPICMEYYINVVSTNCHHRFCSFCLARWFRTHGRRQCPSCRCQVTEVSNLIELGQAIQDLVSITLTAAQLHERTRLIIARRQAAAEEDQGELTTHNDTIHHQLLETNQRFPGQSINYHSYILPRRVSLLRSSTISPSHSEASTRPPEPSSSEREYPRRLRQQRLRDMEVTLAEYETRLERAQGAYRRMVTAQRMYDLEGERLQELYDRFVSIVGDTNTTSSQIAYEDYEDLNEAEINDIPQMPSSLLSSTDSDLGQRRVVEPSSTLNSFTAELNFPEVVEGSERWNTRSEDWQGQLRNIGLETRSSNLGSSVESSRNIGVSRSGCITGGSSITGQRRSYCYGDDFAIGILPRISQLNRPPSRSMRNLRSLSERCRIFSSVSESMQDQQFEVNLAEAIRRQSNHRSLQDVRIRNMQRLADEFRHNRFQENLSRITRSSAACTPYPIDHETEGSDEEEVNRIQNSVGESQDSQYRIPLPPPLPNYIDHQEDDEDVEIEFRTGNLTLRMKNFKNLK